MSHKHTVYMEGGSIYNAFSGCIIERPTILVSKEADTIHGWGNYEDVNARFEKYAAAYAQAGLREELDDLMLIELSEYKVTREMACYVMRRMSEYTATGFVTKFCEALTGPDPVGWLKAEMERLPIGIDEKEWKER